MRPWVATLRPGGLILGYHRIADVGWDPLGLAVHPDRFEQQLSILREYFLPVALGDLVNKLRGGQSVKDLCAITFDDGYRDLLDNAFPQLHRLGFPATVFVATGFAGRTFWWDEIAHLLSPREGLLPALNLRWDESGDNRVFFHLDRERAAAQAVQEICRDLLTVSEHTRASVLEQLREWRADQAGVAETPRAMSADELRQLAEFPGIDVGSHTVTHPMLATLSAAAQREEIAASWTALEVLTGQSSISGFSYPNGSFGNETCRLVADQGFRYACTSKQNVVRPGAGVFSLPRVWAPNADGHGFRRWLLSWRGLRA